MVKSFVLSILLLLPQITHLVENVWQTKISDTKNHEGEKVTCQRFSALRMRIKTQ